MLFSIVVPVYNVEKYLDECVMSIVREVECVEEQCEILLIDDGSTDSSGRICDKFSRQYPKIIRVFHNRNQGLLLARRFGYKEALGMYIINCDSDDCLEKGALTNIQKIISDHYYPDMIIFNFYQYDGKNKRCNYKDIFTSECINRELVLKEFLVRHSIVSMWSKCYKRECIDINRDYQKYSRISNGEDSLQSIELFDSARTYVYLNMPLYNYRMGSGMTQKFDPRYYNSFKIVLEEIEKRKNSWNLKDFEKLFAVKVLSTVGRAITQSRFNRWKSIKEHLEYLKAIRNDKMFNDNITKIEQCLGFLQKDHIIILLLLRYRCYLIIILMLNIKNRIEVFTKNR